MKRQEFIQIKNLSIKELFEKGKTLKKEIADLVMDKNRNILKDLKLIYKRRKDLARVLTVLRQKQMLEELIPKIENKEKKVVVDNSTKKPQSKKKGRTELSKTKK